MDRHPYLSVARIVVAVGGVAGALAVEGAFAFGTGLAAVDSGHDEYWWLLAPLTAFPAGYLVLVVLALLGRKRAAFAAAVIAWLIAFLAFVNPLTGAVGAIVALAATYVARALHDDAAAPPAEVQRGPEWGRRA